MLASYNKKPVILPPGCARLATTPAPVGSDTWTNMIGVVRVSFCNALVAGVVFAKMKLLRYSWQAIVIVVREQRLDMDVAAFLPAEAFKPLPKCCEPLLPYGAASRAMHQHADPPHPLGLLRTRRERPRGRRAAACSQQFPPSDGDCHTPLPCEVRKGKDTTPRACSLQVHGGRMLVASTSVVGLNCTTPAASLWRTPPSRPRASARSRGSACDLRRAQYYAEWGRHQADDGIGKGRQEIRPPIVVSGRITPFW